jgi:mevalonate kinase
MVLSGQAHGKLLLFGEHAVVHGFPALGLTLPLSTRVWLSHPGDTAAEPSMPPSTPDHTHCIESLVPYLGKTAQALWQRHAWAARIQSNVPVGRGLGSSSALTGAVARAFAQGTLPSVSRRILRHMAHQAEQKYHGHPSGVDTALALGSGLLAVTPRKNSLPDLRACSTSPFALVVGTLPRDTNTHDLVQRVRDQVKAHSKRTLGMLTRLGQLAMIPPVLRDAGAVLGERANEAHALLQALELSTPALDQSLLAGRSAGAHGGKLSGAGGGGAFVLFCRDRDTACTVSTAITERFENSAPSDKPQVMIFQWNGHALSLVPDKEPAS